MDELQEALKDLRDIHAPEAISYWPLAPGWWILLGVSLLLLAAMVWWLKQPKKPKYKKLANEELKNIMANYEIQHNSHKTATAVAALIRKLLIATDGRESVASLINDEWLVYLDKRSGSHLFTQGGGRILISAIYQKPVNVDVDGLFVATKLLLKNV